MWHYCYPIISTSLVEKIKKSDYPIKFHFGDDGNIYGEDDITYGSCFSWLFEKKCVYISILPIDISNAKLDGNGCTWSWRIERANHLPIIESDIVYSSWYTAAEDAIEKALDFI